MKLLISAASFLPLPDAAPAEIVYIPEGEHAINPKVDGEPRAITVKLPPQRGAAIAATLQADLTRRLADNVRPIIDFDHRHTGPASGPGTTRNAVQQPGLPDNPPYRRE